jgi:hypothetical protein
VTCVCGAQCVNYPVIRAHSIAAGMRAGVLISRNLQGSGFCVMDGETDENRAKPHRAEVTCEGRSGSHLHTNVRFEIPSDGETEISGSCSADWRSLRFRTVAIFVPSNI